MFKSIVYTLIKPVYNYCKFKLDVITIIELVLFCAAILFFSFHSLLQNFTLLSAKGASFIWDGFLKVQFIGVLLLLGPAIFFMRTLLLDPKNEILLSQSASPKQTVRIIGLRFLSAWLLLLPVWLGLYVCYINKAQVYLPDLLILLLFHTAMFLYPLVIVISGYWAWFSMFCYKSFARSVFWLFMLMFFTFLVLAPFLYMHVEQLLFYTIMFLISLVLAGFVIKAELRILFTNHFEHLLPGTSLGWRPVMLGRIYLILTPPRIKPLVKKDYLYFTKKYHAFTAIFWGFLVVMSVGIWRAGNASEGMQWFLSMCIAAGYVFANMSFRFNEPHCESWALIRALPIRPWHWWLAKFWNGMLPVLWITITGSIVLWLRHSPAIATFLIGLLIVLAISATLVYVATNFGMHSYPWSRYAIIWFNLYIITAILFFTILLFPPLAVGFLLFGYFSIILVFKQIKQVDIV